jgi:nuclear pore complex protein Nup54
MQGVLKKLEEKHLTSNLLRLQKIQTTQHELSRKILIIAQHLHLLIPAIRSSSIRPEEEELRRQLETIEQELKGKGRAKAKLGELWAVLGAIKARSDSGMASEAWKVVDEDGLARLAQVLQEQQAGLAHLTKILQKAQKDLMVVTGKNAPFIDEGAEAESLLSLGNATAKLRGSVFR